MTIFSSIVHLSNSVAPISHWSFVGVECSRSLTDIVDRPQDSLRTCPLPFPLDTPPFLLGSETLTGPDREFLSVLRRLGPGPELLRVDSRHVFLGECCGSLHDW